MTLLDSKPTLTCASSEAFIRDLEPLNRKATVLGKLKFKIYAAGSIVSSPQPKRYSPPPISPID